MVTSCDRWRWELTRGAEKLVTHSTGTPGIGRSLPCRNDIFPEVMVRGAGVVMRRRLNWNCSWNMHWIESGCLRNVLLKQKYSYLLKLNSNAIQLSSHLKRAGRKTFGQRERERERRNNNRLNKNKTLNLILNSFQLHLKNYQRKLKETIFFYFYQSEILQEKNLQ